MQPWQRKRSWKYNASLGAIAEPSFGFVEAAQYFFHSL